MMENGTRTPFPVKMSVKEEGGGEPSPQWLFLHWEIRTKQRWTLSATSPGPCESITSWQSGGLLLRGNLVGSSSTRILSWKRDEEGELPFPSEGGERGGILKSDWKAVPTLSCLGHSPVPGVGPLKVPAGAWSCFSGACCDGGLIRLTGRTFSDNWATDS